MTTTTETCVNRLLSIEETNRLIRDGRSLSLAGAQTALDRLEAGAWIAGTTPYFMVPDGGVVVQDDQVFVTDLTDLGTVRITSYQADELGELTRQAPENGFSLAIVPAGSRAHVTFAADAADLEDAFVKPTVGWVCGVHLNDLGSQTPKVYDGRTATCLDDALVVAYVELPQDRLVSVEIANIFEPGDGDVLEFADTTFEVDMVRVNGEETSFASYLKNKGLDGGQLPLVGDFAGARVNVSLQSVDHEKDVVALYAPVFSGVEYRFAKPVADYAADIRSEINGLDADGAVWGCNCILNFVFGDLEGKQVGGVSGPVTFGEIAYQLLNQTVVQVRIS